MTANVPSRLIILSSLIAGFIFAFDLLLPLGVAGGVPYVALVLLGNWFPRRSHLFTLAAVGTFLTILGFFLSPTAGIFWIVITNRTLALFAIWITAFLIAHSKRAENELREKDSELRRVSRLSDMGQMTSALAHEINQPLTAIASYIQAARRILEKGDDDTREKVYENMDKAVAQGTRAAEIIRRLRQFIEKGETEYSKGDINAIVEEAHAMALLDAARKDVKVRFNLGRNLPLVVMDKIQIQQVVVNLVRNSLDALMESEQRELTITTLAAENNSIEVAVSDTGPGLPEEVAKQLFKPFLTTKPDGMGVGLSICRSIIDEHGGRLWTTPNPGGGTVFRFTLPAFSDTNKSHDQ
ncbi:MAG: ATP-binding protein [Rhodospirillales bacterium]